MMKRLSIAPRKTMACMYGLLFCIWGLFILPTISLTDFKEYYPVPLTMVVGSFIAGFTCEGGGAVSFPVFTKMLHIPTDVARDFAFASQGVGMTFASMSIFLRKTPIEKNVILHSIIGGLAGMVFAMFCVVPIVGNTAVKLTFTVLTVAFAFALVLKNFVFDFKEVQQIEKFTDKDRKILLTTGFIGGIFSALTGSGIDFVTFSFITLYYKIDEKVATPTSVVIMAFYAGVTALFKMFVTQDYNPQSFILWKMAVPVVAIGAPIGAIVCSKVTRMFVVKILLFFIASEFMSTVLIVKASTSAWIISGAGLLVSSLLYVYIIKKGDKRKAAYADDLVSEYNSYKSEQEDNNQYYENITESKVNGLD